MPNVRTVKIRDLKPDQRNANKGTERGSALLETSLRQLGAGRSILVDKDGRVIAGNKTLEQYAALGFEEVLVVETDGKTLVAVERQDLDLSDPTGMARQLAYADNRVSEVSLDWDAEQMLADVQAGLDLTGFWFPDETAGILARLGIAPNFVPVDGNEVSRLDEMASKKHTCPSCGYEWYGDA